MPHTAIVKAAHDHSVEGRWTFEDYDPGRHESVGDIAVVEVDTNNEFDQAEYDNGDVENFTDFRRFIIGDRGTRYFQWDGESPDVPNPVLNLWERIGNLRQQRGVSNSDDLDDDID